MTTHWERKRRGTADTPLPPEEKVNPSKEADRNRFLRHELSESDSEGAKHLDGVINGGGSNSRQFGWIHSGEPILGRPREVKIGNSTFGTLLLLTTKTSAGGRKWQPSHLSY